MYDHERDAAFRGLVTVPAFIDLWHALPFHTQKKSAFRVQCNYTAVSASLVTVQVTHNLSWLIFFPNQTTLNVIGPP